MELLSWLKFVSLCFILVVFGLRIMVLLWWRPRRIEEHFSRQGIKGPPYRFFIGNVKELVGMMIKASSQTMPSSCHNILPRVLPFYHHWKKNLCLVCDGDQNLRLFIKTIIFSFGGRKWAHHRKIITPTFHMENLKLLIPVMATSMVDMMDKWSAMSSDSGEVEIEVSECFRTLTEDIITRTAFGSSYEDGKAIFRLQAQQMLFVAEAFQKASDSSSPSSITVNDIVEECKSFFFAGNQTTSNLLTRRCKAQDADMILNESLRLYPPTVATIRRSRTDVELGGTKVPRGTELLIPILAVHHDQTLWGNDSNEFNPARFAEGVARAAKHPVAFIPFGLGVRMCIGQNLALLQAKLALAIMLQRFSFKMAATYQHAPTVLMLLYPQYGAPVIFQRLPQDQGS
ncbi:hypothetical protein M0R45_003237 [Rubus argutus]|uniref:Cytochrome P450 734A1 n=1 Tax=Rubus argutus TaxID=59490 RepID=A0AAW1YFM5_RUBAR